jgi:beta-glucosidase/6-phospho-beta-glucosidase/beta-galactosidase
VAIKDSVWKPGALPRSQLNELTSPDAFWWATGIEDTFITAPWPPTGRTLDEYALTGHYDRWKQDLTLAASLGVRVMRYGIPWHRIQPEPGVWEWEFADRVLSHLLELGVDPIVDLVHYGLPPWLDGAYLNPDFPARMAEYAGRVAERFRGRVRWYTPLNEPRITAWYCGKLGWWPPFARGWTGFVRVMLAVCRGIVATVRALESVDPEIVCVHVDATDLVEAGTPDLHEEAQRRQELVFLALDLVSGRVGSDHPLTPWLIRFGATEAQLRAFQEQPIDLPIIGLNMYPMFSNKRLRRDAGGNLRMQMPYAQGSDLVYRLGRRYSRRYGRPIMITETASVGTVARRLRWLDDSLLGVRRLRAEGIPMVGYTWWPMFSLVAWAYRQGTLPPDRYLEPMGLWDLEPDGGLERRETPLVAAYRQRVAAGAGSVGPLCRTAGQRGTGERAPSGSGGERT